MASDDHRPDRPPGEAEPGAAEQALRAIEERLARASEAAERLIAEAAAAAARGVEDGAKHGSQGRREPAAGQPQHEPEPDARRPPPSGWEVPGSQANGRVGGRPSELDALLQFVASLRELIPPDVQRRLAEAVRELVLALRALIDWYLERIEQRRRAPAPVEDIPIQ